MFKTRLISGIVLVAIAVLVIPLGGWPLTALLAAVSVIGMSELFQIEQMQTAAPAVTAYLGACVYYVLCMLGASAPAQGMVLALTVIAVLAVYVFAFPKFKARQVITAVFGLIYVAVFLSFVLKLRNMDGGAYLVWLIFLASWGADTCAYCVGMLFGKHKMTPVLSPKKSVEGAVGGVIGAALLGALYGVIFGEKLQMARPVLDLVILCAGGALISMVGDLAASGIKRDHGIKDYGKLIPGHGGILDRFDSVILVAPVIYYLAQILRGGAAFFGL